MIRKGITLLLLLALIVPGTAVAQVPSETILEDAEPYEAEEFSQFALDLRRAEIVAVGTVPLTLFASRFLYGIGRFVVQSIAARRFAPEYLPPFLAQPGFIPLDRTDNAWILAGTVTLSGGIALLDYFLGRAEGADE